MYSDTNLKVERFHISLLRKASAAKKMSLVCSLSQMVIQLSRRAIDRADPGLNEKELEKTIIAYHYGTDLAERFSKYLDRKNK